MNNNIRINNTNKPNLVTEITSIIDKNKNQLKPDDDGFYTDVPLAVLDAVSCNNTWYNSRPFIGVMNSPKSSFNHRLTQGVLTGELDHPFDPTLSREELIQRTLYIDPDNEAVFFRRISVRNINGDLFVLGDLKPHGLKQAAAKEKLEDPNVNCAFSLRSLTKGDRKHPKGYIIKNVSILVTFDIGMAGGGFPQASKMFKTQEMMNTSNESLGVNNDSNSTNGIDITLTTEDLQLIHQNKDLGLENIFTNAELTKVFKLKKLIINGKMLGYLTSDKKIILGENIPEDYIPLDSYKDPFGILFNI